MTVCLHFGGHTLGAEWLGLVQVCIETSSFKRYQRTAHLQNMSSEFDLFL